MLHVRFAGFLSATALATLPIHAAVAQPADLAAQVAALAEAA